MDVLSREIDLHSGLQTANCSINFFRFQLDNHETSREALSQDLYGADFDESDVRFLETQERPVLLAQLQAAKSKFLAEGPNVHLGRVLATRASSSAQEETRHHQSQRWHDI